MAKVTLNGSKSTDPDGDALGFTWAWAIGANTYLSNGVSLTVELPIGVHTVQLMVSDGHVNSQPDEANVTVVAPLECKMKIAPSTINLGSNRHRVLACIRLPGGFTTADVDGDAPLLIYPGGIQTVRRWSADGDADQVSIFAFFDRDVLAGELQSGPSELTVVGTLRSGQLFYGRATVQVMEKGKVK